MYVPISQQPKPEAAKRERQEMKFADRLRHQCHSRPTHGNRCSYRIRLGTAGACLQLSVCHLNLLHFSIFHHFLSVPEPPHFRRGKHVRAAYLQLGGRIHDVGA